MTEDKLAGPDGEVTRDERAMQDGNITSAAGAANLYSL